MRATFSFAFMRSFKSYAVILIGYLFVCSNSAHAVLINFDELDSNNYVDAMGDRTVLTNEYASKGLLLEGPAYLIEWAEWNTPVSLANYVVGPGFGLKFIGELPTFVSFYLGSSTGSAVFIDAQGPHYSSHVISSGEIHGMTDDYGTPYIPNQVFSFFSEHGISSIDFSGQSDAYIDDLTYTYASVPEPSAVLLLAVGLFSLVARRARIK